MLPCILVQRKGPPPGEGGSGHVRLSILVPRHSGSRRETVPCLGVFLAVRRPPPPRQPRAVAEGAQVTGLR